MSDFKAKLTIEGIDKFSTPLFGLEKALKKIKSETKSTKDELKKYQDRLATINVFDKQTDGLKKAKKEYELNQKALDKLNKEISNTEKPTKTLIRSQEKLAKKTAESKQTYEKLEFNLNVTSMKMKELGVETKDLSGEKEKLISKEKELNSVYDKQKKILDKLNNADKARRKNRNSFDRSVARGRDLGMTGRDAIGTGTSILNTIARPLGVGKDFNAAMSAAYTKTVLTIPESERAKRMEDLRGFATKIGGETSFTQTQVANLIETLGTAGVGKDINETMLKSVLNTAKASKLEPSEAASIVMGTMSAFGIDKSGTDKKTGKANVQILSDKLAYSAASAQLNMADLGQTFEDVAPIASALGYNEDQLLGLTNVLADSNIKGSKSATSLQNILLGLNNPKSAGGKALKTLEVDTKNIFGETLNPSDLIKKIAVASKGRSDRNALMEALIGRDGLAGFLTLLDKVQTQKGFDKMNDIANNLKGIDGFTDKTAEMMGDNLDGDILLFNSSLEALYTTINDKVDPHLRSLTQTGKKWIDAANQWAKENGTLVEGLMITGGVIGSVVAIGGGLLTTFGTIATGIAAAKFAITSFGLVFGSVMAGVKVAMYSTGVLGIIMALGTGAYYVYTEWDKVKAFFVEMWDELKPIFSEMSDFVTDVIPQFKLIKMGYNVVTDYFDDDKAEDEIKKEKSFLNDPSLNFAAARGGNFKFETKIDIEGADSPNEVGEIVRGEFDRFREDWEEKINSRSFD